MNSILLAGMVVRRGTILLGAFEKIDHKKFFVIIGENKEKLIGFFFINSDICRSVRNKPHQFEMQMPIKREDYNFLNHTSFVAADKINTIRKDKVASDIVNGVTKIMGELTEDDLDRLLDVLRNSMLFSKIEKESFFG